MDYLASMFIDDELNLEEKGVFVDRVHADRPFYQETRALLLQEQMLRIQPDTTMLPTRPPRVTIRPGWLRSFIKPMAYSVAGFACALLLVVNLVREPPPQPENNRFVIYEPAAQRVELVGSFTGWQPREMEPIGTSGYWELILPLPSGEHRFAYILNGSRQIADPTLPIREKDDFGGENSILTVGETV